MSPFPNSQEDGEKNLIAICRGGGGGEESRTGRGGFDFVSSSPHCHSHTKLKIKKDSFLSWRAPSACDTSKQKSDLFFQKDFFSLFCLGCKWEMILRLRDEFLMRRERKKVFFRKTALWKDLISEVGTFFVDLGLRRYFLLLSPALFSFILPLRN